MSSELLSALNKNGSGLNLRELTTTLVAAETSPRRIALQGKMDKETVKLSALGQVRAQLSSLSGALAQIAGNPVLTVSTSTAAIMPKVTDRNQLRSTSVPIDVQALATRQVLEFGGFSSPRAVMEAGRITVEMGQWDAASSSVFTADGNRPAMSVEIPAGSTLEDVAGLLSKVTGVTARVINKGDGTFSLGIVGETGAANGLRLTADSGDGGGAISLASLDTTANNAARQVQGSGDARVIVDGIMISRPSNTLKDVLPGMDITITAVMSGALSVERDATAARANVETLVAGLNETMALLKSLTARGFGDGVAGDLAGDRAIEGLEQAMRKLIATPLQGHGDRPVSMVDLGVATQRDGMFRFDPPAFDRTFAARSGDFDALMGDKLHSLTEGMVVRGNVSKELASGSYDFRIGADGSGTLGGYRMLGLDLGGGARTFIGTTGPVQGLLITVDSGVSSGKVQFGRSLVGSLGLMLADAGASTGTIGRRETDITNSTTNNRQQLDALEAKAAVLQKRYLTKFAAMEQTVSRMNSTGSYIQNLVDMWARKP